MNQILIWDFDGTLAERTGGWSGAIVELLQQQTPACTITPEQIRAHLLKGFPWHAPEIGHAHLATADQWWTALTPVFDSALCAVGIEPANATKLAWRVREQYLQPDRWHIYEDSLPALRELSTLGWKHILLSNHVPELDSLVKTLGLTPHLARVFNSATIGYEKPHPEAFGHVLREIGPTDRICMIGDSMAADIQVARAAGIPAILVRKAHPNATHFCANLKGITQMIERVQSTKIGQ